ncbi:hypothetical protein [Aequorivita sinensis]|uniref:hypothetical protein n=1 Tax=Aequorivita sinensis TaxID=1382458 RepID=UPI00230024A6|nr:hypothetical protein [Aequorivita sinensis]
MKLKYAINKATIHQIKDHLIRVDEDFAIPLRTYVDINHYAKKLADRAICVEIFAEEKLVGLLAIYYNVEEKFIFGSNFSIDKEYRGKGLELFKVLLNTVSKSQNLNDMSVEMQQVSNQFIGALSEVAKAEEPIIKSIHTEVHHSNRRLILYYKRLGFKEVETSNESIYLIREI